MKCRFRLTRSIDFQRVRRSGRSYAHPLIVLVALPNKQDTSRLGVAAGRSVGNAVKRNRCKRVMRESVNSVFQHVKPGYDLVLLARQPLYEATYQQTREALVLLLRQAQLLKVINGC